MATRPRGDTVDEEFLHALYRGGELLAAGKVIEAKDHLEKAFKLQPKNEKGQNLLGLTYFKLGLFERAAEIYEMLVRENPADPTLRVNLGLVYLKTNGVQRAIREFEVATDLAPDHKKSHNYLGLALAQAGEFGRAREHFLLAGSDQMAQKMERALAGESVVKPLPKAGSRERFTNGSGEELETAPPATDAGVEEAPKPAPARAQTAGSEVQIDLMSEDQSPPEEDASSGMNGTGGYVVTEPAMPSEPEIVSDEPPPAPSAAPEVSWGDQFGLDGEAPHAPKEMLQPAEAEERLDEVFEPGSTRPAAVAEAPPLPEASPVAIVEESVPSPTVEVSPDLTSPPPDMGPPDTVIVDMDEEQEPIELVKKISPPGLSPRAQPAEVEEPPPPAVEPEPAAEAPPPMPIRPAHGEDRGSPGGPPTLAQLAPQLRLDPKSGVPFVVEGETVTLHCDGELLTRLAGLMGYTGRFEFVPEMKRFRGRQTDKPFGEGERRMTRVKGKGLIAVDAGKQLFIPLDLGDDSAYFREDVVFAFEEAVMFENGRVPSDVPPDLDLVHLRGAGKVLLAVPGPLKSLEVKMDQPVTVPLGQLVGWHGNLTPRMVPVGWDAKGRPSRAGVELSGEGFALFALLVG